MDAPIDINHIAYLARINLDDEETIRFQKEIEKIVSYVETISEVDLSDVEPTARANQISNVLRDDNVCKTMPKSDFLDNAPEILDHDFIQVPKVIANEG